MSILRLLSVLCLLLPLQAVAADPPAKLQIIAKVGPWAYATKPISYQDRIWFANANRWPDHNSADIWSVKPDGSDLRRERRLFSQDVGEPIVHRGLLYWPFEDPRVSLGWGQIAVTNGKDWRVLETRIGRQFHLHGLFRGNPDHSGLLAGGSSWNAQILQSSDRGRSWEILWERKREEKRFSRTYNVVTTAIGLVADLMVFGKPPRSFGTVGRLGVQPVQPIAGWPDNMLVRRMTPFRGGVLALLDNLQTDEARLVFDAPLLVGDMKLESQLRDIHLPPDVTPVDFDSFDHSVALLARREGDKHQVWVTPGEYWQLLGTIGTGKPSEIRMLGDRVVVTGTSNGLGAVWSVPVESKDIVPRSRSSSAVVADLPQQIGSGSVDVADAQRQIADALADPRSYVGHGIRLRNVVDKWVTRGLSGEVLAEFLDGPFPEGEVKLIGGRAFATHERFGRWILTWGMRRAGNGRVPPEWLDLPVDEPENDSQKYFGEKLAAIWTVAATGQDDRATVAALRRISTDENLPEWLRQDAVWAVHQLRRQ